MTYDAVYLSPHLDDAVLSCGGTIHRQVRAGQNVAVATVFAGDLADDPQNRLLREVYDRMGLRQSEAMAARREEDLRACARLGANPIHWDVAEALGRHADLSSLDALFEEVPSSDGALTGQLAARLEDFAAAAEIFAPLGLGGHIDHRVTRRAAVRAFGQRVRFYEDFPYVLKVDAVDQASEVEGLASEIREVEPKDLVARIEAIASYKSQVDSLFGSRLRRLWPGKSLAARVRGYVDELGGERFWFWDRQRLLNRTM